MKTFFFDHTEFCPSDCFFPAYNTYRQRTGESRDVYLNEIVWC